MTEVIALTPWDLALAALLLVVPALISIALKLGLESRLAVAATRTVLQLGFIGLVLEQVFALDRWYLVLPVLLVMLVAAARAAIQRSSRRIPGAYPSAFAVLVLSTTVVTFTATELIIGVEHWYEPRYVIPILGMLLGNGLTGISLGLDRMLEELVGKRDQVEARLALGLPLWRATLPWFREAVRAGMIPILNSMTVVGLVSLPGMMTGQILGGADPMDAVSYQILILFMIASATALGTMGICGAAWRILADPMQRVRWERISEKK